MPHVRFTRDKRGYEHTFLVRRGPGGRGDTTVLYWFRTPPDVRVGRRPLDEESTGAIERAFPDVRFDWPRLRETYAARVADDARAAHPRPEGREAERRIPRARRSVPQPGRGQRSAHQDVGPVPSGRDDSQADPPRETS